MTIDVQVGQLARLVSKMQRRDGLVDVQEVIVKITRVDDDRAEYEVTERLREANVLHRIDRGGFARAISPERFAEMGFTLLAS